MASEIAPELEQAVTRTLYHHHRVTPIITQMLIGKTFETPPPLPTDEERAKAESIVEELVGDYFHSLGSAYREVLGEDPDEDWV